MLRIALLGPPQIEADGRAVVVDTRKAVALLSYVAVVGRPVARESLAELLWPEADPDGGRGALRRTLSALRSGLGGAWLRIDRRQVALDPSDVELDVGVFRDGVAGGGHAHLASEACSGCRRRLARAVSVYGGDFLEGFALRDSAAFDEWQLLEAEALRGELADTLRRLVSLEAAEGRRAEAIASSRRLLALDQLDEEAHRALIRLLAEGGDRSAAVRQYRECVRILERELGVGPSEETVTLYQSLLEAPDAGASPAGAPAEDPRARIDGLGEAARELLDAAAVLGDQIDPDLAREVSGRAESETPAGFEELVRRGVLREPDRRRPRDQYGFADDRVLPLVREGLGLARRRLLHRRAARALQARFDQRTPDSGTARSIAIHLAAGGDEAAAARFHRLAGDAARADFAHGEAAGHYRAAVALGHPDRLGLQEALGDAETLRGRYGEALAAYELGAALADGDRVAGFEHRLGSLHLRRGAHELADLHLAAALTRLGTAPSVLGARVLADRSLVAVRRGRLPEAKRLARAALGTAKKAGDPETESQAENLLGMLARRTGDATVARRHLRRSLERAGVARHAGAQVAALNNLALLERSAGELDAALALTEEALRRCVTVGDRHREAALRNNRADLLHALGRRREADEEQIRAVAAFAEVGEQQGLEPEIWKLVEW